MASLTGNTVRLTATFVNWASAATDPDIGTVVFRVYDSDKGQLGEDLPLPAGTYKKETGVWQYDYIVPAGSDPLTVEFYAEIDSFPIVNRMIVERVFYND